MTDAGMISFVSVLHETMGVAAIKGVLSSLVTLLSWFDIQLCFSTKVKTFLGGLAKSAPGTSDKGAIIPSDWVDPENVPSVFKQGPGREALTLIALC